MRGSWAARTLAWAWLGAAGAWGCGTATDAGMDAYFDVPLTCDNYCNIMLRHCRNTWQMYPTHAACLSTCATWPERTDTGPARGNSLECRLLYGHLAMQEQNLASDCYNAGPAGGQVCHDDGESLDMRSGIGGQHVLKSTRACVTGAGATDFVCMGI